MTVILYEHCLNVFYFKIIVFQRFWKYILLPVLTGSSRKRAFGCHGWEEEICEAATAAAFDFCRCFAFIYLPVY